MFKSKNDMPKATRVKMIALLNTLLADCVDLQSQMKQAHWNVKGPNFIGLHELFDQVYHEIEEYVDSIAERAIQLGGAVEGTVRIAAKRSNLHEYPLHIADGQKHVEAVASALAAFGKEVRDAIDEAQDLDDADTADIFTEVSRGIDKSRWFVEAHLQADH